MNLTAIILAGGASRRMGTNKALVPFRGKPLVHYSIDLALQFTDNIAISSNGGVMGQFGFPVIADIVDVKAPLVGIHAGLVYAKTDWVLVLTCDMPLVSPELIRFLFDRIEEGDQLVVPGHDGFVEPLCGFYHRSLIQTIESHFENRKFSPLDLLPVCRSRVIEVAGNLSEPCQTVFRNVNERSDLE
jgi:molybdopterin-guanine dinucleotide biosynthesis protein A